MRKFYTTGLILLISLLFLFIACEQTVSPQQDNSGNRFAQEQLQHNALLVDIVPDSSNSPFDFFTNRKRPHPRSPQEGVLSLITNPENEEPIYYHYPMRMGLPPGLTGQSNQPVQNVHIVIRNQKGIVLLDYKGEVTDNPRATELVQEWIQNVVERVQKTDRSSTNPTESNSFLITSNSSCYSELDYSDCHTVFDDELNMYTQNCELEVCAPAWEPPPPGSDPWNDWEDPCDDPWYNCDPESGGGSPNPGGGDNQDCSGELLPPGCDDPEVLLPCLGDPVPNPEIAPTENLDIHGGRYNAPRSGGRTHNGLDIRASINSPLYPLFSGTVYAAVQNNPTLGNYVIVESNFSGTSIYFLYAHLQSINVHSGFVNNETMIARSGNTGNAAGENIVPHVHIEVRTQVSGKSWNDWDTHNPENFLSTKFDEYGSPIPPFNCR